MNESLDIQPELVTELLTSFLLEELGSAGFDKAVVGLSGGIDSAVSAALAACAFGGDRVLAVRMPYVSSNPDSEAHALEVIDAYGLATKRVDITAMVDGYCKANDVADETRRGNIMARCRMTVLYDLSVDWRGLVIGTSNKTEMLLGYSTQFGDSAHAVNPLGDLYKHQLYQVARHLGVPDSVVNKAPSADLFEGQTDEDDLGFSYELADHVLFRLVDQRATKEELIAEGFDEGVVSTIVTRVVRNQYKRLLPVIAKLSGRTINHDFRYLRDWLQ